MLLLQFLKLLPRLHGERPVALHAADVIVLVADAVQAQIDADAALGAFPAHTLDHRQHAVGEHPVGGDGDHLWLAVTVGADHHLVQILAQEGFAAGKGDVKGRCAQLLEDLVPLFHGHVVVGLAPHIAGTAFAVATKAHADDHREGFDFGPAKGAKGPV